MQCTSYLTPRIEVTKTMEYQQDTSLPQTETFDFSEFFTKTDEPGCTGVETCELTTATGETCGQTLTASGITFDASSKAVTASKSTLVGSEHLLCMKCTVHANLEVTSIFTIKQNVGCGGYLAPKTAVTKTMEYQGDSSASQTETFDFSEFFTKTDEPGCTGVETCTLTTATGETCGQTLTASVSNRRNLRTNTHSIRNHV